MIKQELNRGQFLKKLGLSSKALMAFYCMGSLAACSSEDDPAPNNPGNDPSANGISGTSVGANINFTIDLNHANFTKLKTEGEFAYAGDVIVANASGVFIALAKNCTHEGTIIAYRSVSNDFRCPNHGSEFAANGTVTNPPAVNALTVFNAVRSTDGNSLKIS